MKVVFIKLIFNIFPFDYFLGGRRMSERDMTRVGNDAKPSAAAGPQLLNSKSVPALHHIGESRATQF